MVRISKKPLITKNWMQVETIHGVPNVLTSRASIALAKKSRETAGLPPIKHFFCIFCGRKLLSIQALRGHLRFCKNREAYQAAMRDGFRFVIGTRVFTVKTKRWSLLRETVRIETDLNRQIAEGVISEEEAVTSFTWLLVGAQAVDVRSEMILEPAQVAEVSG